MMIWNQRRLPLNSKVKDSLVNLLPRSLFFVFIKKAIFNCSVFLFKCSKNSKICCLNLCAVCNFGEDCCITELKECWLAQLLSLIKVEKLLKCFREKVCSIYCVLLLWEFMFILQIIRILFISLLILLLLCYFLYRFSFKKKKKSRLYIIFMPLTIF